MTRLTRRQSAAAGLFAALVAWAYYVTLQRRPPREPRFLCRLRNYM